MYLVRRPHSQALRPFVHSIQYVADDLPHDRERMIPTADMLLLMTLDGSDFSTYDDSGREHAAAGWSLVGPRSRHSVVSTQPQRGMVAVSFRLGAAAPFLGISAAAVRDAIMPLGEILARDCAGRCQRVLDARTPEAKLAVLEQVLVEQLAQAAEPDPGLIEAVGELHRGTAVRSVVEQFGTTPKPFIRRFEQQVGMTPKRFSRVRRLQRTLAVMPKNGAPDWPALAAANGYYDQSHLIHDFGELAGVTPSEFQPRSPGEWNHQPL